MSQSISEVLVEWAERTRSSQTELVLSNHLEDCRIYDVLAPISYASPSEYKAGWDEWQPEATDDAVFEFTELAIEEGDLLGFAFGIIQCAGSTPDGGRYEDVVRATFCLKKIDGLWKIAHQHISSPLPRS